MQVELQISKKCLLENGKQIKKFLNILSHTADFELLKKP